jgi:hypothetical protein
MTYETAALRLDLFFVCFFLVQHTDGIAYFLKNCSVFLTCGIYLTNGASGYYVFMLIFIKMMGRMGRFILFYFILSSFFAVFVIFGVFVLCFIFEVVGENMRVYNKYIII